MYVLYIHMYIHTYIYGVYSLYIYLYNYILYIYITYVSKHVICVDVNMYVCNT